MTSPLYSETENYRAGFIFTVIIINITTITTFVEKSIMTKIILDFLSVDAF